METAGNVKQNRTEVFSMKGTRFLITGIIIIVIFFNACYAPTGSETYYFEHFLITKANYNSVPYPSSITFNSILSYRNKLRNYATNFQSSENYTQETIYSILKEGWASPAQADDWISEINHIGNGVFYRSEDALYYLVIYIEKQR